MSLYVSKPSAYRIIDNFTEVENLSSSPQQSHRKHAYDRSSESKDLQAGSFSNQSCLEHQ